MIPVFLLVTIIAFGLMNIDHAGDPVVTMRATRRVADNPGGTHPARVRARPLWSQYLRFLGGAVRGDFGKSFFYRQPVTDLILRGCSSP